MHPHKLRLPIFFSLAMMLIAGKPLAQLCTGSLGDPVVKIDFGKGYTAGGFVPSNSYKYTASGCPNDGYYTVARSIPSCWGGVWHMITDDHTGGGGFLLVNATYEPGDFYVGRVRGLCPGTTYEFAAWVMNVVRGGGIKPNITFRVESASGAVLQQYSTGDIPVSGSPQWKQYGFFFTTTSANTDLVLRITNNAPGGIGNDIAMDDITFRPCGPLIAGSIIGHGDSAAACVEQPNEYTLNASVSGGFSSPVYQWQVSTDDRKTWGNIPGATGLSYVRPSSSPGTYWYRLAVTDPAAAGQSNCSVHSNLLQVKIHPPPYVNAGPDRTSLSGNAITLQGQVGGDSPHYVWRPSTYLSDTTILNPALTPLQDQQYTLHATSLYGCQNQDEVMVRVANGIYVPTAFTPNNDGINDRWRIPYLDPSLQATVRVFNRYGQVVYQVTANNIDWDGTFRGTPQPSGTFVYQVTFGDGREPMRGTLTLIR